MSSDTPPHTLNTAVPLPPRPFEFEDPLTGLKYGLDAGIAHTASVIAVHRGANGHKVENIREVIDELGTWICGQLTPEERDKHCVELKGRRTMMDRVSGAGALAKIKFSGESAFIGKALAEKRAKICAKCPLNRDLEKTKWEQKEDQILLDAVRRYRSRIRQKHEDQLNSCGACGCLLTAKIHLTIEVARTGLSQATIDRTPKFCWLSMGLARSAGAQGDSLEPITSCGCL